jgi:serine protease inhibitor
VVVTTTGKPAAARDFSAVKEWLAGTAFTPHTGDLALPRFAASGREDLLQSSTPLGCARHANLPPPPGLRPGIVLSQMTQRVMIEIDEEGAEAAAATAAVASRMLEKRGCHPHGGGQAVRLRAARRG